MHRTYLVVGLLAVFAALIVGVNVGKKMSTTTPSGQNPLGGTPTITPSPAPPQIESYTNAFCGFSLNHPDSYTLLESASGSAILSNTTNNSQSIVITCQEEIPRPPLIPSKIETIVLSLQSGATMSARLYHDASPKDGTPIDALIFAHPSRKFDVFIAGFGEQFNEIIKTITILP